MWPRRGEALDRTIEVEAAVSDLYAEALRRWVPHARAAVLPSLTAAAGVLPPDPDGLAAAQGAWDEIAERVILAGLDLLWTVAYLEAAAGLGIDITADPAGSDTPGGGVGGRLDSVALSIVARATGFGVKGLRAEHERIASVAAARDAVDRFVESQRPTVAGVPSLVREELAAVVDSLPVDVSVTAVERDPAELRAETKRLISPASTEMRDLIRRQGYQAAGVMNDAVISAAGQYSGAGTLQKTWLCTLDSKTRASHWASDGARVALDGTFTVGGEQLRYPGDPKGSPKEVRNCRCRVGVLAADEKIPDEVDRHTERLDGRDSVVLNRDGRTQQEEIERRAAEGNIRARDTEDGVGRVASAAPTGQEITAMSTLAAELAPDPETFLTFTDALVAVTGVSTSDGRMLSAGIDMTFRDTPMPLQWCEEMEGGHFGSVTVGVIESIRLDGQRVLADGYMLNNESAGKAIELIAHGVANPSIDFAAEIIPTYEDGTPVTEENYDPDLPIVETSVRGEVMAVTIVAIPAFGETRITLNPEREPRPSALVAAAVERFSPRTYDPRMFADPQLSGPTHVTMSQDGRIFGHVACWSERHRSVGLGDITPPRSQTGYANFHSSPPVLLSDGSSLPVGRLTVGIGHAPTSGVSNAAAQVHYDNAEACFALVRAGEDEHGIWVSGVPAPWASAEKVEMGLASPISGDWRPYGGALDLIAVLAVNTPGFLCRGGGVSQAEPLAMVASLGPARRSGAGSVALSWDDVRAAVAEVFAEQRQADQFASRRAAVLARAQDSVGNPPTRAERVAALLDRA